MRIAVFVSSFPVVSQTFVFRHVEWLLKSGHDVTIFPSVVESRPVKLDGQRCPAVFSPYNFSFSGPNGLYEAARCLVLAAMRNPRGILKLFARLVAGRGSGIFDIIHFLAYARNVGKFDVIHAHFGPCGRRAARLKALGAIEGALIVTMHGADVHLVPQREGLDCYTELFNSASFVTIGSEFMRECVKRLDGLRHHTLRKVPMGVPLDEFPYRTPKVPFARPLELITVARLVEGKGHHYGLAAVKLLKKIMRVRWTIIGDGPEKKNLERRAVELDVAGCIEFRGAQPIEDSVMALMRADICLFPGIRDHNGWVESQGVALAEAQAVGLPVVASDVGGIPETVTNGITGLLVAPCDPASIADAIKFLADNSEVAVRLSHAARASVEKHYDANRLLLRFDELYREAVGR